MRLTGLRQLRFWAAVLGSIVSCCWVGWVSLSAPGVESATATAAAFLKDLAAGDFEAAYARTSTEFQERHSLEAFRAQLKQDPLLQKTDWSEGASPWRCSARLCNHDADSRYCQVRIQKGQVTMALGMLDDGGSWKVCACIVQVSGHDF